MFTSLSINPRSVAAFVSDYVSRADKEAVTLGRSLDPHAGDYAIELVADLSAHLRDMCSVGSIDNLSDDNSVEFRFTTDGLIWDGTIWVTVFDDLPGCPCSVNCSIAYYSEAPEDCTAGVLGTFPEERYEAFDLDSVTAYSLVDVQQIRLDAKVKEVESYVAGYAAGEDNARVNAVG